MASPTSAPQGKGVQSIGDHGSAETSVDSETQRGAKWGATDDRTRISGNGRGCIAEPLTVPTSARVQMRTNSQVDSAGHDLYKSIVALLVGTPPLTRDFGPVEVMGFEPTALYIANVWFSVF